MWQVGKCTWSVRHIKDEESGKATLVGLYFHLKIMNEESGGGV